MIRSEFLQLLGLPDPEAFTMALVDVLTDVYRFNSERHEEAVGDDEQVFGFTVYRHSWFRIEEVLALIPGVETSRPNNSLLIRVPGPVRFHVYRGGNDESFDILSYDFTAGTFTKLDLSTRNGHQLSLFAQEVPDEDPRPALRELVFVHAGNPDRGLTGVWVGAPVPEAADGSQWAWVLPLYSIDGEGRGRVPVPADQPVAPYDAIAEPDLDVQLRPLDEEAKG